MAGFRLLRPFQAPAEREHLGLSSGYALGKSYEDYGISCLKVSARAMGEAMERLSGIM